MTLMQQNVTVNLNHGVDTKTDPKKLQGKLVTLQNGYFQTVEEIRKRNGYAALATGPTSSVGSASFKNELLNFDGVNVQSYATGLGGTIIDIHNYIPGAGGWVTKGQYVPASLAVNPVTRNTTQQTSCDSSYHVTSGLQLFAYMEAGTVSFRIIDFKTQNTVLVGSVASTSIPKCSTVGNYLVLLFYNGSAIQYIPFPVKDPSTYSPSPLTMVAGPNTSTVAWDVELIGTNMYVVFSNASSGVALVYMDATLSVVTVSAPIASQSPGVVTVFGDADSNVWVSWFNTASGGSGASFFAVYSNDLRTIYAGTTSTGETMTVNGMRNMTGVVSGSAGTYSVSWFYENLVTSNPNSVTTTSAAVTLHPLSFTCAATAEKLVTYAGLASKAFLGTGTLACVTVVYISALNPTYFVLGVTATNYVTIAKVAPGLGGGLSTYTSRLPEANNLGGKIWEFAFLQKDLLTAVSGTIFTQTGVGDAVLTIDGPSCSAELGSNLHMSGGCLMMYDGKTVCEHGFHYFPEGLVGTPLTTGGSMGNGSYQYVCVYEWTDNQGQIHRSAPGIPLTLSTAGTGATASVTNIAVGSLMITQKTNVSVALYRTAVNGTVFYRVSSPTTLVYNRPTMPTTIFATDTMADSSLIGNEQLYTTGGEVENISTPAILTMTTYANRLIAIPSDSPQSIWYSKEVIPGSPVEFSNFFVLNVDQRGGNLSALGAMDDKLILFKPQAIFVLVGQGPSPNGANNDFTNAQLVCADDGCSSFNSIILIDDGLMYQGVKGISLLSRNLTTSYIGADVEAYGQFTVAAATLVSQLNQVRFAISNNTLLVFDYYSNQWSVFTNHSAVDAVLFQGLYTFTTSAGIYWQESFTSFTDAGSFIQLSLTTSWLSFVGIQEFQRVYEMLILGDYQSQHSLVVSAAYDFVSTITQTQTIPATSAPTGGYQWRFHFAKQKCEAIQITLSDSQSPTFGEGCRLSALTFVVGKKAGANKIAASKSYG